MSYALTSGADLVYLLQIENAQGERQTLVDEAYLKYSPSRSFALHQNYPNPFNPETAIRFVLQNAGPTSLRIYNVAGRMIKELVNEDLEAGSYVRDWYGDDSRGIAVSSGTYYYRLVAQGYRETRRMVLLK